MVTMIDVENLGKKYKLGGQDKYYKTLRECFMRAIRRPFQKFMGEKVEEEADFWALRNVTFTVKEGEVVGLIGRNGAGKSTLLKVLSRITRPTEGKAKLYGRVGSLLEVGTGFHPELTGKENIFLSGNLLGMKRFEVKAKYDEIVAFSEIEKFLDTPVKHYSTGMYVRLGFSIAAHLDPEILLVDEVLAVGDVEFQKKCLGKMGDVAKSGRTVIFVSHSMTHIESLCDTAIFCDQGHTTRFDRVVDAIQHYQFGHNTGERNYEVENNSCPEDCYVQLLRVCTRNEEGEIINFVDQTQMIAVEMEYEILKKPVPMLPHFFLRSANGQILFPATIIPSVKSRIDTFMLSPGKYRCRCEIPGNLLNTGTYTIDVFFLQYKKPEKDLYESNSLSFTVTENIETNPFRVCFGGTIDGAIRPLLKWENESI